MVRLLLAIWKLTHCKHADSRPQSEGKCCPSLKRAHILTGSYRAGPGKMEWTRRNSWRVWLREYESSRFRGSDRGGAWRARNLSEEQDC